MTGKEKWGAKSGGSKPIKRRNNHEHFVMIVLFSYLSSIICCISCSKDEINSSIQANIELLSSHNLFFNDAANLYELNFTTNVDWEIQKTSNDNWYSIQPNSGTAGYHKIIIKVEPNNNEDRTSSFAIIAGTAKSKINIIQQKKIDIIPSKERYTLEADETSFNLEIKANIDYNINSNASWVTIADSKSLSDGAYTIFVQANISNNERIAEIIISNNKYNITKTVTVRQFARFPKNNQLWYLSINGKIDPSEIRGFNTNIKSNEFDNDTGKGVITFDDDLTTIGNWAFNKNSYLGKIWMPSSVTKIGNYAFCDCYRLNDIVLSSNITDIGQGAFKGCSLEKLEFPSVINISESAFEECESLKSIYLSDQIPCIQRYTFKNCTDLEEIKMGNNIKYIGYQAFSGCSTLSHIILPSSLDSLGQYAFSECSKLTTVDIPNSVEKFGGVIFQNCTSLKSIKGKYVSSDNRCIIKDSILLSIAPFGLDKYTLPNEISVIPEKMFYNSTTIEELTIPQSVNQIDKNAFEGCTSDLVICCDIEDCIWETGFYGGKFMKVKITGTVNRIAESSFKECRKLQYVEIDEGVSSIGFNAFINCISLKSINLPSTINNIEARGFDGCTGELIINCNVPDAKDSQSSPFYWSDFSSIVVGDHVEILGDYVFCNNWRKKNLRKVSLGRNIRKLGKYAFSECSNLESLTIYSNNPPIIDFKCFDGISKSCILYVPIGTIDNFSEWKDYFYSIVEMK